jgi:hypothetical protein
LRGIVLPSPASVLLSPTVPSLHAARITA